jgi:hypothetical protein
VGDTFVNVEPTILNRRLSQWIQNRAAADTLLIAGRAAFWHLVGFGFLAFGLGVAIGIAFYGYSYIARNSENISSLSAALSKALSEVELRATADGMVQIEPRELSLAEGQMISLDSSSRLQLDSAAKVAVDGEIRVQVPAVSVPQNILPQSASTKSPITNFTVFKMVPFGNGKIMTGWVFLTSTQKSPTHQYCYYTEDSDTPGVNVIVDIGTDQQVEAPRNTPRGFDIGAGFDKCVWFRTESP